MLENSLSDRPASGVLVARHVGVVGLGHMGHAFAVNLLEDGHRVSVYDRDPKRTAEVPGAHAATRLSILPIAMW
jgi:6-phosphogluconate dehydrogenase